MRALITVISIIALILSIAACQGAAGPAGEQGPPGPQGSSGAPALVDEATVASLIEQIQEQLDTGYATVTVPPKSTPADYTKFVVRDAISRYESEGGLDATVAYYNTKESVDGQWYVFIIDENQTIVAHAPDPDLVGKHISQALGPNSLPHRVRRRRLRRPGRRLVRLHLCQSRLWRCGDQALLDGDPRRHYLRLRNSVPLGPPNLTKSRTFTAEVPVGGVGAMSSARLSRCGVLADASRTASSSDRQPRC